ncbi:hypothetical protein ASD8599_02414 [Ascidiaceihabitans donghaensis]|uniref:PRC-barrel domain-containing protein n=1 Tax=Ascidiaceihabitans donghaensis TaxID=1510460 RepID=A0A2R8BF17_9RHOB|nr:hypothetical protein [Ascidiaceihabitans donghaensis]SPH21662.1 hypothetical protein ASD8599_02414 [Ascidiaceihabitans donghaensis]
MKRNVFLTLTAASAIAATGALAGYNESETDNATTVASTQKEYDTNSPANSTGDTASDIQYSGLETKNIIALENAKGEMLKTNEGEQIGVIEEIDYNAQGNPELVIDVFDKSVVGADRMVMTIQPDNIVLAGNAIVLDTTYNELLAKVKASGVQGSADRVDVTIF